MTNSNNGQKYQNKDNADDFYTVPLRGTISAALLAVA